MKPLASAILILLTLVVMSGVVVNDLREMFPRMDAVAWAIVVAGFAFWILLTLWLDGWIVKRWPGRFKDDQRTWFSFFIALLFLGVGLYLGWGMISPLIASHFGVAVR